MLTTITLSQSSVLGTMHVGWQSPHNSYRSLELTDEQPSVSSRRLVVNFSSLYCTLGNASCACLLRAFWIELWIKADRTQFLVWTLLLLARRSRMCCYDSVLLLVLSSLLLTWMNPSETDFKSDYSILVAINPASIEHDQDDFTWFACFSRLPLALKASSYC